jgi:mannose-6-phosphate isomerase-like protein (cupin superfamily)
MIIRADAPAKILYEGLTVTDYTGSSGLGSSVAIVEVPPGARHPRAWSKRSDKFYLVIDGHVRFSLGDVDYELGPRDFCHVRRGERFAYENPAPSPATLVLVHTPSFELDAEVLEGS